MSEDRKRKYQVKFPKLDAKNKTYTFTLSLPGLVSAIGGAVVALTFFFVLGILIGRGYRPEADVPQLARIMPSKVHGQVQAVAPEQPEVLKAEELDYPEQLAKAPQQPLAPKPKAQPEPKAASRPAPKPEAEAKALPAAKAQTEQPGAPVYAYVYQAASFRKLDMAEKLRKQLAAAGLNSQIQSAEAKGTTWYRVNVLHTGTEASTSTMKAALAQFKIRKPLLRGKTQVQ